MNWIETLPKWIFSAAFILFFILLGYLAITGVEFRYKDKIQFVHPDKTDSSVTKYIEAVEVIQHIGKGGQDKKETVDLGDHDACFLVAVNERDGGDTACIIHYNEGKEWELYSSYSDCSAVCLSFKKVNKEKSKI